MTSCNIDETIEAKKAYEHELYKFGKICHHYHADNGTYSFAKFKEAVYEDKQTLTYCSVGSHFQNGKAENRIKYSIILAHTMLLHAAHS